MTQLTLNMAAILLVSDMQATLQRRSLFVNIISKWDEN